MADIIRQGIVTTRKPHVCWRCFRPLPKGTEIFVVVSVDGRRVTSTYWCPVCEEEIRKQTKEKNDAKPTDT